VIICFAEIQDWDRKKIMAQTDLSYRISTITARGFIFSPGNRESRINVETLRKLVPVGGDNAIVWTQGADPKDTSGVHPNAAIRAKKGPKKKFNSQSSFVMRFKSRGESNEVYYPNAAIFTNGKCIVRGIHRVEDVEFFIRDIHAIIKQTDTDNPGAFYPDDGSSIPDEPYDMSTQMVNAVIQDLGKFSPIQKKNMFEIARSIGLYTTFDPETHQSLMINYYDGPKADYGVCTCNDFDPYASGKLKRDRNVCLGKGTGQTCKKVVIMVFSSSINIVGARDVEQLEKVFSFLKDPLLDSYEEQFL